MNWEETYSYSRLAEISYYGGGEAEFDLYLKRSYSARGYHLNSYIHDNEVVIAIRGAEPARYYDLWADRGEWPTSHRSVSAGM